MCRRGSLTCADVAGAPSRFLIYVEFTKDKQAGRSAVNAATAVDSNVVDEELVRSKLRNLNRAGTRGNESVDDRRVSEVAQSGFMNILTGNEGQEASEVVLAAAVVEINALYFSKSGRKIEWNCRRCLMTLTWSVVEIIQVAGKRGVPVDLAAIIISHTNRRGEGFSFLFPALLALPNVADDDDGAAPCKFLLWWLHNGHHIKPSSTATIRTTVFDTDSTSVPGFYSTLQQAPASYYRGPREVCLSRHCYPPSCRQEGFWTVRHRD